MAVNGLKDTIYRGYAEQPPWVVKNELWEYGFVMNIWNKKNFTYITWSQSVHSRVRCNIPRAHRHKPAERLFVYEYIFFTPGSPFYSFFIDLLRRILFDRKILKPVVCNSIVLHCVKIIIHARGLQMSYALGVRKKKTSADIICNNISKTIINSNLSSITNNNRNTMFI